MVEVGPLPPPDFQLITFGGTERRSETTSLYLKRHGLVRITCR